MRKNIIVKNEPVGQAIIQALTESPANFMSEIYANDDHYLAAVKHNKGHFHQALLDYFTTGDHLSNQIWQILQYYFSDLDQINSILEFGCNGGQLTRFLVEKIDGPKIWVSDPEKLALNFLKEQLEVNIIPSSSQVNEYLPEITFDCILATNLAQITTEREYIAWVQKFYNLLNDHGILIFSTGHALSSNINEKSSPIPVNQNSIYHLYAENFYPDRPQPHLTYTNPSWLAKKIQKIIGTTGQYLRLETLLNPVIDWWIIAKNVEQKFNNLKITRPPIGRVEKCEFTDQETITISGYALDLNPQGKITDIAILVNGKIKQKCLPHITRTDLSEQQPSGWICQLHQDLIQSEDMITIKISNNWGQTQLILSDTISAITNSYPQPPGHLLHQISGSSNPDHFLQSFANVRYLLKTYLRQVGREFSQFEKILDFGCGVGRFLLAFSRHASPYQKFWGCDVDQECANWCQTHIKSAPVIHNNLYPPLPYNDHQFDLIYATSVWTHLRIDLQHLWAWEMYRILEPGGLLLTTIHGVSFFPWIWTQAQKWQAQNFDIYSCGNDGLFLHLDADGQENQQGQNTVATGHTPSFCQQIFSMFRLLQHFPQSDFANGQDLYIWQKPLGTTKVAEPEILPNMIKPWQIYDRILPKEQSSHTVLKFQVEGQRVFRVYAQIIPAGAYPLECDIQICDSEANRPLAHKTVSLSNNRVFGKTHYSIVEVPIPEYRGEAHAIIHVKITERTAQLQGETIEIFWNFANFA